MGEKVTVPMIRDRKGEHKLTMVTAYDFPSARIADLAGFDIILVGDSVANVVHGHVDTLAVSIDTMVLHTSAVARAMPKALVVGDMPWMSYHTSVEDTIRNAGRLIRDGGAEAVKLEGGRKRLSMVEALINTEIPVMGHLGLTPQSVHSMGGYRVQGRAVDDARTILEDARLLTNAGCFAIVLEGVPDTLAELITKEIDVPTIGIGAGPSTDGQVLVFHDLLGLVFGRRPKFVRAYADLTQVAVSALKAFIGDVQSGAFPSEAETYHMSDEAANELLRGEPSDPGWPLSW